MGKNLWVSLNLSDEYRKILDQVNKQIKLVLNNRYETMDHEMYHMTTLFLGDKFRDFTKLEELLISYDNSIYELKFDSVCLFHPEKRNLLIVKFKQNLKLKNDVNIMKKIIENNDPVTDFLPHITLGKLKTTKKDEKEFSQQVEGILNEINKLNNYDFISKGFCLCGK